jgi:multidrug efflux pump subunit AcrA (membrane-fusion protein)
MFASKLIRYLTFLLALAGAVGITLLIRGAQAEQRTMPSPPTAPPEKPYARTIAATGILEAMSENVEIGVPQPGIVTEVFVKVSQVVNAGDPLLKLDDRELQAQLLIGRASLLVNRATREVKQATLTKTQDMLTRLKAVPDQRAISQDDVRNRSNDVLVAKAEVSAAEAQVQAAEAQVKSTELLLERLTVRTPQNASILQVNVRAGEYASTQPKAPPLVIGDLQTLQVRADVDEQSAVRVRVGKPGKAFIKGDAKTAIPLTFVRIEPYVIPKTSLTGASTERVDTRVLQVIYSLAQPQGTSLYVGQQVDVYIDDDQ